MRRFILFKMLFIICTLTTKGQTIGSTVHGGPWEDPSTWAGNIVPTFSGTTHVIINGTVTVGSPAFAPGSPLIIDQLEIGDGNLLVLGGAEIQIRNGNGVDLLFSGTGQVLVDGKLTLANSSLLVGNSEQNLQYRDGSLYEHQATSASSPLPVAFYAPTSTILVTGFASGTFDASWNAAVGNFIYDCPGQGSGVVNLAGMLAHIQGNLSIHNTGTSGIVYGDMGGSSTLTVGGDFELDGLSCFVFTSSGTVNFSVGGDFLFGADTSAQLSQSSITGNSTLIVNGNFNLTSGAWNFTHGSAATLKNLTIGQKGLLTSSADLIFLGNLSNDGAINFNSGTVSFRGFHQHLTGASTSTFFSAVTIDVGTTVTSDVFFSVASALTANDSLICNAGMVVGGSLFISNTGNLLASRMLFKINGPATISSPGSLVARDGANAFFSGNISASGSLLLNDTTFFSGNTILTGAGPKNLQHVVISGSMTPNAIYTVTGSLTLTNSGTLNAGINTTFISGNNVVISRSGPIAVFFNNLTITGGSTLTSSALLSVGGSLVVAGNFISNGGFSAGAVSVSVDTGVLTINDTPFTVDGTLTVSSGGIMNVSEGADATLSGNISASGSVTVLADTFIDGITFVTGGGTKQFGSLILGGELTINAPLTLAGRFTIEPGGILHEGISTVTFDGQHAIYSCDGAGVFHNVLIAADSQFTNATAQTVNGTLRVSGIFAAGADLSVANTLTISRGGTLSTQDFMLDISGNFAISGSYSSLGKTRFSGTTKITGAGTKNFHDIEITGSLTAFNGTITVSGDILNDGVFIHNNGIINFTGDFEKKIYSTLTTPPATGFYSIHLTGGLAPMDLVMEVDATLAGVFSLDATAAKATTDLDGTSNNRTFTLLSTNDDPATDGSFAALSDDAIVLGNFTVQRFMHGEGRIYRYLCSPVPGATVADWQKSFAITGPFDDPSDAGTVCGLTIQPENSSLFYYNEEDKAYVGYPTSGMAADHPLKPGNGYAAFIRQCTDSTVISVTGSFVDGVNRGNVSLPVSNTDPVATYNNLIGNPYPSAIAWDKVSLFNVASTIAIRDNASGIFQYYSQGGVGAADLPNGAIAQGQAFWVRTTGATPAVVVSEAAKTPSTGASGNVFYRKLEKDIFQVTLASSDQSQSDNAYIVIVAGSLAGETLDAFDAPKLNNQRDDPYQELLDVSTSVQGGTGLAVNALPKLPCGLPFQLTVNDLIPSEYYFTFKSSGLFNSADPSIWDDYAGKWLSPDPNGAFHFSVNSDPASQARARFTITFEPDKIIRYLNVNVPPVVCGGNSIEVTFTEGQTGINYFASLNGISVSDTLTGNAIFPASIAIFGESLKADVNHISIRSFGACQNDSLDSVFFVRKILVHPPAIFPATRCNAGKIELAVKDTQPGELYYWFENDTVRAASFSGFFLTDTIKASKNYYVASVDSASGCESVRTSVTATVVQYADAHISVADENTLTSNFKTGNHWFVDQELIDTTFLLKIARAGLYTLKVTVGPCETEDARVVSFAGTASLAGLSVYPNPVRSILHIAVPNAQAFCGVGRIINAFGVVVQAFALNPATTDSEIQLDLSGLSPGVYTLVGNTPRLLVRIIKL